MTLKIHIDDSAAPYEQVRAQISEQARSGVLPVGYRLPTVRGLAEGSGSRPTRWPRRIGRWRATG